MYKSKKPYLYGTGRRKSSIARVRLYEGGTGKIPSMAAILTITSAWIP